MELYICMALTAKPEPDLTWLAMVTTLLGQKKFIPKSKKSQAKDHRQQSAPFSNTSSLSETGPRPLSSSYPRLCRTLVEPRHCWD